MILASLSRHQEVSARIFPHLKEEYFFHEDKEVYNLISNFIVKYKSLPTKEALLIELEAKSGVPQTIFDNALGCIIDMYKYEFTEAQWIVDVSEKYCKDVALQMALNEAVSIVDAIAEGKAKGLTETMIPEILTKAISISFDTKVGSDYLDDASERYDRYLITEDRIPFEIDMLNQVTNDGFAKKRLHIFIGGVGGGKSLTMCSLAASNLSMGKNVLYVSLELNEDEISKRIDANLLGIDINQLHYLGKDVYLNKINSIKKKTLGRLKVCEDMSGQFSAMKLRYILDDYKLKQGFIPDVVYIDYLGICISSVYKPGTTTSYIFYKAISEEMRNLANQYNFCCITAMQLNRANFESSDAGLTGIADSFGVTHTADWIGVLITSEELKMASQIEISQVKSRYSPLIFNRRFLVGIDRPQMRIYNLDLSLVAMAVENSSDPTTNEEVLGRMNELKTKLKQKYTLEE